MINHIATILQMDELEGASVTYMSYKPIRLKRSWKALVTLETIASSIHWLCLCDLNLFMVGIDGLIWVIWHSHHCIDEAHANLRNYNKYWCHRMSFEWWFLI
eukprot:312388_1